MEHILVTGANGQLGTEINKLSEANSDLQFRFTDVNDLNITSMKALNAFFLKHKPSLIINCAAYNLVDKAENDPDAAILINSTAVANLASLAEKYQSGLIHISTDYVFDGLAFKPYKEEDIPNPLSAYARSKRAGELEVLNRKGRFVVIRTSWLYSPYGQNFAKTILKYGKERGLLKVVNDQTGTPTCAADLAEAIIHVVRNFNQLEKPEIFHFSNEGSATWYDFAHAIVKQSGINCKVIPVGTEDYPLPAARPFYSVLNKSKIKSFLDIEIPHWIDSLEKSLPLIND